MNLTDLVPGVYSQLQKIVSKKSGPANLGKHKNRIDRVRPIFCKVQMSKSNESFINSSLVFYRFLGRFFHN